MNKTEFFYKHGSSLVESALDCGEFGNLLFLHPQEIDKVKKYESTHQIVSIHETEDGEDFVDVAQPCDFGSQPYKYGYFVIKPAIF